MLYKLVHLDPTFIL